MNHPRRHTSVRLAVVAVPLLAAACSSTPQSAGSGGAGGSATGGAGGAPAASGLCANSQITVLFSPMYSAYDGTHKFQVPAVVNGLAASAITWSASDPTMVDLAPFTDKNGVSGTMITAQKAGAVDIIATAGGLCGKTTLTITAASADDWEVGSARYNNGVVLTRPMPGQGGGPRDGGNMTEVACTNCHGDTATSGPFKTVAHTPQQTGGFSDEQLINIFRNGMIPAGGYFDSSIVSLEAWQNFHRWQMSDDQARGIVVYLRSLTPTAQTGSGNFGGRFNPGDGGMRPPFGDGGFGPPGPGGRGGADAGP